MLTEKQTKERFIVPKFDIHEQEKPVSYVSKMKEVANGMSEDDARIFCQEIIKKYPSIMFETCITEMTNARSALEKINNIIKEVK